jgi:hypothetical protein
LDDAGLAQACPQEISQPFDGVQQDKCLVFHYSILGVAGFLDKSASLANMVSTQNVLCRYQS